MVFIYSCICIIDLMKKRGKKKSWIKAETLVYLSFGGSIGSGERLRPGHKSSDNSTYFGPRFPVFV